MFSNLLTLSNFLINGMKELTFILDKAIYSLVESVYAVFYYLASASILNDRIVENFTLRIYTILGILMVFILAWNLLNYIVDPDKITDKKIGASTFLKDVIIALVIISMSPMLFTKLYSFQSEVLSSGVIANLILGGNSNEDAPSYEDYASQPGKYKSLTDYYIQNGANTMVASVYVAFLYPNDGFTALDCDTPKDDGTYTTYCESYQMVKEGISLNAFSDFITHDDYNFTPFLTTVAGIVLLFFTLSFCINLAKRVGKMAILQLLAPIPCTLELLPNKKGTRDNWIKTLVKVYCEVFMYLAVIYLVIFLISLIPNVITNVFAQTASGEGISLVKLVTVVILIYGLLMFGKEAPQMVFDLLGIKSTGVIKEAFGRAVNMAGVTGGLMGSTVGRFARNFNDTEGNIGKKILSGVAGAGSGAARTLWGARNVKSLKDAANLRKNVNQKVTAAKVNRSAYWHAQGGTVGGWAKGHATDIGRSVNLGVRSYLGASNDYQTNKRTEQVHQEYKKLYSEGIESIWKSDSKWQAYNAELLKAEAIGDATAAANAKTKRDARQAEALKENKLKFMEAAGRLNNFIDAHQGVSGVTADHIDLDLIGAISSDADAVAQLSAVDAKVKDDGAGGGFKPTLDGLKNNTDYQKQKVQEKLREDAKQANKKAAEQASNKDKK